MFEYAKVLHREREQEANAYRLAHSVPRRRRGRVSAAKTSARTPSSIK